MADIDEIISGVRGNTRYDFSTFGDPVKQFFDASKQADERNLRRAFKDGVPTDAGGQPDYGAMMQTLFQKGGINEGIAASKLGIAQQQLKAGQDMAARDFPGSGPAQPQIVSPPSSNRSATASVAPAISQGKSEPEGQGSATIMQVLSAQGIPNDQLGAASASIARQIGVSDPNAPINVNDPQIRNVLVPAVQQLKRMGIGQPAQPGQPAVQNIPRVAQAAPQPAPAAVPQATPSDPTLGGLVPPGRTPQQQLEMLSRSVASGMLAPEVAKVYEARIKALQEAMQPTTAMKEAAATGKTLSEHLDRGDENKTQLEILKGSIIPKLDKSQETATAARDEIQSIHRAREQLDAPGGIFSGAAADVRLKVAKVAEFLGVPNADKISNTESFGSAIGARVLSLVKGLGAGAGISNADRDFAAAMAGGNIKLDEGSIRRILDIGEKAARARIDQHNALTDRTLAASEALRGYKDVYKVEAPGAYKKAAADPYEKARAAIAAGAPRDAVAARLKQSGYDPGKL